MLPSWNCSASLRFPLSTLQHKTVSDLSTVGRKGDWIWKRCVFRFTRFHIDSSSGSNFPDSPLNKSFRVVLIQSRVSASERRMARDTQLIKFHHHIVFRMQRNSYLHVLLCHVTISGAFPHFHVHEYGSASWRVSNLSFKTKYSLQSVSAASLIA